MIVAHHVGEDLLPTLLAGGASAAPALLLFVVRGRLSRIVRALRRQRSQ